MPGSRSSAVQNHSLQIILIITIWFQLDLIDLAINRIVLVLFLHLLLHQMKEICSVLLHIQFQLKGAIIIELVASHLLVVKLKSL